MYRRIREKTMYHPTKKDALALFRAVGGDSDYVEEAAKIIEDMYSGDYTRYNAFGPLESREDFIMNGYEDIHELLAQDPNIYEEDADLVYLAFGEDYYEGKDAWEYNDYEAEEADHKISEFHDEHGYYDI